MNTLSAERLDHLRTVLCEQLGASRFRTWFGETTEFRLSDCGLDVIVPSAFAGTWIAKNYMGALVDSARRTLEATDPPEVRIIQRGEGASTPLVERNRAARPRAHPLHDRRRPGEKTPQARDLASFVVGPCNRLAHAAASAIVQDVGTACKLLVLHGGCGLGKTHLLQGIWNGIRRSHASLECKYVSGEEFTNDYIFAVRAGPVDVFRARYRSVDVLLIDDVHFLANKKATQEEFLHTFNALTESGMTVVVSCDRHPRAITAFSEPLMDRLISGLVVQIDPPNFEIRRAILAQRAAAIGLVLDEAILDHVAQRSLRNVRELEGAVYTLCALQSVTQGPISNELAARALDEAVVRTHRAPDPESIERLVMGRFGVTREQLHSRSRDRTVVLARGVAMLLARRHTRLSFPEIGRAMGRKNHSTVLMAAQRLERMIEGDENVTWRIGAADHNASLRRLVESLEQELHARDQ
ncbi:MAG: chromosomal replication initiator protein DnaA [Planctomycetes bacterium]|nr:chromosomal replication initiator protein DnaA [Planctomycetota bacterium]